jgi:hypothetical protein
MVNRVTCITTPNSHSRVEHITHLGGLGPNGGYWHITREEMIADIKSGSYAYHVAVGGFAVAVEVGGSPPNEYVKTTPDAATKDNLLSLPPCK